jgi:hypothetical protein
MGGIGAKGKIGPTFGWGRKSPYEDGREGKMEEEKEKWAKLMVFAASLTRNKF